jgi:hypothetical protein
VATAILVAAHEVFKVDLAEVWGRIVRRTIATDRELRLEMRWFSQAILVGPRLQQELPRQLPEKLRNKIAIAAAQIASVQKTEWLGCIVNLGKTYRNAGDFPAAVKVFRDNLPTAPNKIDFPEVIRGYWYEWGMSVGALEDDGSHLGADAWLQGLSIADHLPTAPITFERAKLSFAGLGVAFGKLAESRPDCPFARARRACAYLGRLTTSDPKALGYFAKYDRDADRIYTPYPEGIEDAIAWLTTAVAQAGRKLEDPFLKALLKPEQVSFNMLRDFLNPAPRPRPKQYTPLATPQALPIAEAKPVQLPSDFQERINTGIERVLKQAWEAVPGDTADVDRFSVAKRKASDIIPRLSPAIRRQVNSFFHSKNWEPLKSRDPKL